MDNKHSLFAILFALMVLLCGTATVSIAADKQQSDQKEAQASAPKQSKMITIERNGRFEAQECQSRGLEDKVIMIESSKCGACKRTRPEFEAACKEKDVTPLILDVRKYEEKKQVKAMNLEVQYTPTFIFGCNYYVGGRSKEAFLRLLENM